MREEERPIETGNSTQRKGKWELEVPLDQLREVENDFRGVADKSLGLGKESGSAMSVCNKL
jgi:hypothetical protein